MLMNRFATLAITLLAAAGAQAQPQTEAADTTAQAKTDAMTLKRKVAIGRFSNETQYAKGIFYDRENDPMGKQALDILSAKLAASGKFLLLERSDLQTLADESRDSGKGMAAVGADYVILGSVTEFGRKNTGKNRVFSSEKTQTVEAAVAIRLVDVSTGLVVYSDEAKGSAEVTTKTTLGFGGQAGFDATLSDKAISNAIAQLVQNIISKCTDSPWKTYFLACGADGTLIAGGKSQGIKEGMTFSIMTKGRQVRNPQTGIMVTLPGKKVGEATVTATGGGTPETEYSFVKVSPGTAITADNMADYVVVEAR